MLDERAVARQKEWLPKSPVENVCLTALLLSAHLPETLDIQNITHGKPPDAPFLWPLANLTPAGRVRPEALPTSAAARRRLIVN